MNEITIAISEKKKRWIYLSTIFGGPLIAAICLIIYGYAYLRISGDFSRIGQHVGSILVGVGVPVLLLWSSWSSWKRLKTEKWIDTKFQVDEVGIKKELADGEVANADWRELKYVSIPERILYFEDGRAIRVYYDFKGQTTVSDEEWLTIVKLSGSDSILTNATIEREAVKPSLHAEWGIRTGAILGLILIVYLAKRDFWQLMIGLIPFAVAVNFVVFRIQKPQKDVDKRYAPPEDFQATVR